MIKVRFLYVIIRKLCLYAVILRQKGVYFIEFVTHYDYNSLPFLDVISESAFHVSDKRIYGCVYYQVRFFYMHFTL